MVPSGSSSEQALTPGDEVSFDKLTGDDLSSNLTPEHPFNTLFHGSHVEIRPNAGITLRILMKSYRERLSWNCRLLLK